MSKPDGFTELVFNMENNKRIAVGLVSLLLLINIAIYGVWSDRCNSLLHNGYTTLNGGWQPGGCSLRKYTAKDIATHCPKNQSIAFVGDSRLRQLYFQAVTLVHGSEETPFVKIHSDMSDQSESMQINFYWMPMLNKSLIEKVDYLLAETKPQLIVVGTATWSIKESHASVDALKYYRANLTLLLDVLERNQFLSKSRVIFQLQDAVDESLLSENRSAITNEQIDLYNKAVVDVLPSRYIWWTGVKVSNQIDNRTLADGLHLSQTVLKVDNQMLLNLALNQHCDNTFATCCRSRPGATITQIIMLALYAVVIVSAILWTKLESNRKAAIVEEGVSPKEPSKGSTLASSLVPLAHYGAIMTYMFICDRTSIFSQENKHTNIGVFLTPLTVTLLLGLFYTKKLDAKSASFLNRDQTDEWKGWMQLVILIYHWSGTSSVLPVYNCLRAIVSAYITLNGFAHATFMLNGGVFNFQRLCKQLFRLNFLTIMMCLTMNVPYIGYYFVPLITFWFLVVILVFSIPPRPIFPKISPQDVLAPVPSNTSHFGDPVTRNVLLNAAIRLFFLFIAIEILFYWEDLFNLIFTFWPIKFLFLTPDGSLHEWRFRWELDRYSALSGCVIGLLIAALKRQLNLPNDGKAKCQPFSLFITTMAASVVTFVGFFYRAFECSSKVECNKYHPWIIGPVVLAFIFLRNLPKFLRQRFSTFMAWFGKISLELFLAQYHIWLALDTAGILVIVPFFPVINAVVTTFIFVCASHELQSATVRLSETLIADSTVRLVQGFVAFSVAALVYGNYHYITSAVM